MPRHWRARTCPRPSALCGGSTKLVWARLASASTSRCSVYWRPSGSTDVEDAVGDALRLGAIGFDFGEAPGTVPLLSGRHGRVSSSTSIRICRAPWYAMTSAKSYMSLLSGLGRMTDTQTSAARPPPQDAEAGDLPATSTTRLFDSAPRKASITIRYLLRLAELAPIDRRAPHGRAASSRCCADPRGQEPRRASTSRSSHRSTSRPSWSWPASSTSRAARTSLRSATGGPARPTSPSVSAWRPARCGLSVGFITDNALVYERIEARDDKQLLTVQEGARHLQAFPIVEEVRDFVPLSKTGDRAVVRGVQPTLRAGLDPGHHQSALRRMDRGVRLRAPHRARSSIASPTTSTSSR